MKTIQKNEEKVKMFSKSDDPVLNAPEHATHGHATHSAMPCSGVYRTVSSRHFVHTLGAPFIPRIQNKQ